jgi:SAM-dependent methyltransferase
MLIGMTRKTKNSSLTESSQPIFEDIRSWFDTPLGKHVLNTESAMLDQLLPGLFGYHLAQFSVQDSGLHGSSPIQHKINVNLDGKMSSGLVSVPTQLPFSNDSIDVVLLHHLLDFTESPQEILRELFRVTLPMGHIVIVGFNPLSLWGLWRSAAAFKGIAPWNGRFIRAGRLMDWLNLLNFKIDRAQYAIYRPPVSRYLGKVEDYSQGVSRNMNLPIGSVYVIVARKHIGAVRPIRPVWSSSTAFGPLSVVRSVKHDGLAVVEHEPSGE